MTQVVELTIEEHRKVTGKKINNSLYFNVGTMPSGRHFVTKAEVDAYNGTELAFLKSKPVIDFDPTIPDSTPPTPTGMGVVVPSAYLGLGLFPNGQFKLSGYVVPLTPYNGGFAVDLAYLGWVNFRAEQDFGYNETVNETFSTLWYTLKAEFDNGNIVQL